MSELTKAMEAAVADARQSYVLNAKRPPIEMQTGPRCPDCEHNGFGACRLVFGMQSDGEFPQNKPMKRKRFTLLRPIIATKACKCDGCGYWWPAFSFTPEAVAA